jgi:hypothetical protein
MANPKTSYELENECAEKMDKYLRTLVERHKGKMEVEVSKATIDPAAGFQMAHTEWNIKPVNSKAARITVYGVDEHTVNLSVDETHWLEVFMRPKHWDEDFVQVKSFLDAIVAGRIEGWYRNPVSDGSPSKTILELDTPKGKITYSGNIFFRNRFKRDQKTRHKTYEAY